MTILVWLSPPWKNSSKILYLYTTETFSLVHVSLKDNSLVDSAEPPSSHEHSGDLCMRSHLISYLNFSSGYCNLWNSPYVNPSWVGYPSNRCILLKRFVKLGWMESSIFSARYCRSWCETASSLILRTSMVRSFLVLLLVISIRFSSSHSLSI